ncbi:MAG: hypothetical protein AAGE90_19410 [Pseudomonadota bacterium]
MEVVMAVVFAQISISALILFVGVAAVAALFYWLGRRSGGVGATATEEALGREMLRMRRQNVVLTEERDQLREMADRQRRTPRRRGTTEEAA